MALQPPDGIFPFFMSNSGAEKNGLKNGPAIIDLVPQKTFNTATISEDIKIYGFMCAFEPCKNILKGCNLEEFVIVCDPTSKYGEMFLLLHTEDAIESYRAAAAEKERAAAEAKKLEEAKAAEEEAALLARQNVVYVETPVVPQEYHSSTMDDTLEEVKGLSFKPKRPLISFFVSRPVHMANKELNFGDRDHDIIEFLPREIAEFDLNRIEQDVAIQAAPLTTSTAVQTSRNRKTNKITQYEVIGIEDTHEFEETTNGSMLSESLKRLLPIVETALQENETVDIFSDALNLAEREEYVHFDPERKNQLREIRNFTDLEYSKGRKVSCIDWHPTKNDVLGASVCKTISFDQRVSISGYDESSFIILWEFSEWIHPMMVLHSPFDCSAFRFNPTLPSIIVGGCMSGQVIMWNTSKGNEAKFIRRKNSTLSTNDVEDGEEEIRVNPPLKSCALSHPETSHRRMIADLVWLPPDIQINAKGKILSSQHLSSQSHQFVTVSGDGQVLFWDIRFEDIARGKLPHVAKPKPSKIAETSEGSSVKWGPLFRIKTKRLEGAGEVSLCKMVRSDTESRNNLVDKALKSQFICSSEEGDILSIDIVPKPNNDQNNKEEDNHKEPEYVQWMARDHTRPCVALAQSPFFPEIIVTVSDWNFHLWKVDDKDYSSSSEETHYYPFLSSPHSSTHLTGGRWSPTRPGVLFVPKTDGSIDVWDFTDSSYSPTATVMSTPSCITSMEFLVSSNGGENANATKQQLLAIGDLLGSLHVFEIPRNLSRPLLNEKRTVKNFFEREVELSNSAEHKDLSKEETKPPSNTNETNQIEKATPKSALITQDNIEEAIDIALMEEEEEAYRKIELEFKVKLGMVSSDDDKCSQ